MKPKNRREFMRQAGLSIIATVVGGWSVFPRAGYTIVANIEGVSAFSGPFLLGHLEPGQVLSTFRNRDKVFLAYGSELLGWLPDWAALFWSEIELSGRAPEATIERCDSNEEGRMLVSVRFTHEEESSKAL